MTRIFFTVVFLLVTFNAQAAILDYWAYKNVKLKDLKCGLKTNEALIYQPQSGEVSESIPLDECLELLDKASKCPNQLAIVDTSTTIYSSSPPRRDFVFNLRCSEK